MTKPTDYSRRFVTGALASAGLANLLVPITVRAQAAAPVAPPLSVYGKLPAIENVALSPDGKRVAMIMSKAGERIIYDYDLSTQKAAAAVVEGDKLRELMWADNSHILIVSSKTTKDVGTTFEQWFGLIMDLPAGKRVQMYTKVPGILSSEVYGDFYRVKLNGEYRVTAYGLRVPEGINMTNSQGSGNAHVDVYDSCLYAFATSSTDSTRLDEDIRDVSNWAVKPDGQLVGRSEYDKDSKVWTLRRRVEKGWTVSKTVKSQVDLPALVGLGRDGESLLLYMRGGEQSGHYVEIDAKGSETAIDLPRDDCDPIFHPQTYALAGFKTSGSIETYVFYDAVMGRLPALVGKALPGRKNQIVGMAENPRQVLIRSEGDGDSGTYYFFDFTTGSYKTIGAAYPDLPAEWVAEKSYVTYPAADGLEIGAWVTIPPDRDAKALALVVLPHGGPESYDDASFDWMSQALASRGYVVLQPNYRGSSGQGREFTAKGYGEYGRKMQTDLSDGVAYLVKTGMVDPKRVAIAGASYGGYASLAGVTLQSHIYNCAVSIAGISDVKTMLEWERVEHSGFDNDGPRMTYLRRFMGDQSQLDEISPIRHVDGVTVPVLLIHGKDDTVVPFEQSEKFYAAMKKAGKSVDMVLMNAEDHWLSREPTRVQTIETMVAFLLKNNPPV